MKTPSAGPTSSSECIVTVHVADRGVDRPRGALQCKIGEQIKFSATGLATYFSAKWDPIVWDALLLAGAVEFADMTKRRPAHTWRRSFEMRVPVHDAGHWNAPKVNIALRNALELLTGDDWQFKFIAREKKEEPPAQMQLSLDSQIEAVIPFSNGLDSCAVAGLMERKMGTRQVRIRLGSGHQDAKVHFRKHRLFTHIPYEISAGEKPFVESSGRSRGFKFALISGLAAFLTNAGKIIVPESGQGALGPSLVTVGQAGEDYRSHPLFTVRMEAFLQALLGYTVKFDFPRIWSTKAETLRQFVDECNDTSWRTTRSCWRQQRHSSVNKKWRQCGICAACMLRRMSVHAAGLCEPKETYVWEDLSAATFEAGAAISYKQKESKVIHQYAIAGTLHLDHLAGMLDSPANVPTIDLSVYHLSESLGLPEESVRHKLDDLLRRHALEWKNFVVSLGKKSFIADWAVGVQP